MLRNRHELDRRIAPLLRAPWAHLPAVLRHILRIGAYQLMVLERVPAYAAVQATVELAKRRAGARSAGMVNAVLRRLASTPDSSSAAPSHPDWLVKRWRTRFGAERTKALVGHNDRKPALVLQPARWSAERLYDRLAAAGIAAAPAPWGSGIALRGGRIQSLPGFAKGAFYVQDPAQVRLLESMTLPPGARVWDACAAPGGKTAWLALSGHAVIASDYRRSRLARLSETVTRLALRASLLLADAQHPPLADGTVEVVLVDAPCSGTGTMARHPDARWRLTPGRVAALARRQRAILDGVAGVVPAGGWLVYMTCSLEREENEDQVTSFIDRHPEFSVVGDPAAVFPPDAGTDGGFAARLARVP